MPFNGSRYTAAVYTIIQYTVTSIAICYSVDNYDWHVIVLKFNHQMNHRNSCINE